MKIKDSLIMLSDGFGYGARWLESKESEIEDDNIRGIINYILEKEVTLDAKIDSIGVDKAFKSEINSYYGKVSELVIEPIAFIPLLATNKEVDYMSYTNALVDSIIEDKVKEGKISIKQYIDIVMTGSELGLRYDEMHGDLPELYKHLKSYEVEAMVRELRRWLKENSIGKSLMSQLSPHNLLHYVWFAGQIGLNKGHTGREYRGWAVELGLSGHPVNVKLEDKVGLYKWFKGVILRQDLKPSEKEIQVSSRVLEMLEDEVNEGHLKVEDIHVVTDKGHIIAYKVKRYTLVFLGRLELYEMKKRNVRVDERIENKVLEQSVHKTLVRDMKKIVKMMVVQKD